MSLAKKVLHMKHHKECENGGSGVSSWNDLTDKPFYEEETVIASCDVEIIYNNELQDYEWHSYMLPNTVYDKTVEYKIIVDNEVYYSKVKSGYAQGIGSLYYIGANLPYADESNNDYPFCLYCPNARAVGDNLIQGEFRYNPREYEVINYSDIHKSIQIIDPTQITVYPIEPKFIPNADWEQNDENGEGYIKNRTHYREWKYGTILKETTVYFSFDVDPIIYNVSPLVAGQEYDVLWDGILYKLTAFEFNGGVVVGNQSMMGQGENTGEPFVLGSFDGALVYFANSDGEHTFSLSGYHEAIKKIDNVFLPTTITIGDMDGNYTPAELFFKGRGYSFAKNDVKYEDGRIKLAHIPLITTEYYETYIETNQNIPNLNETVSITTTDEDIINAIYDCYLNGHFLKATVGFTGEKTYTIHFVIGQMWYSNPSSKADGHITGMTCAIDGGIYTFQASFNNDKTSVTVNVKRVV